MGSKVLFIILYILFFVISIFIGYGILYTAFLFVFLVLNLVMFFLLISLIGNLGFYLIEMCPLRPIVEAMFLLFGGLLFPLSLLPKNAYKIFSISPFSMVGYKFSMALQKMMSVDMLIHEISISIIWAVIFYLLYKITFKLGLKRYEGMGA